MSGHLDTSRRLVVIADDLTGALDCSAPFATAGLTVSVATRPDVFPKALATGAQVVAVSTRSREIAPQEAHDRVAGIVAQLTPDLALFKKIDSRMKGQIARELDALPPGQLFVAPAIPRFGRIVRSGAVQGFGLPAPIPIAPLLGSRAATSIIPDTATHDEMCHARASAPEDAILVGALGLTSALAGPPRVMQDCAPKGRLGIGIGSVDPITLEQVRDLRAHGIPVISAPGGLHSGPCVSAQTCVVQATDDGTIRAPAQVARDFARVLARHFAECDTLLLTGGATAEAALDAFGIDVLDLRGEAMPGLPVSLANGRRIITKSGGFGQPDTLRDLLATARA